MIEELKEHKSLVIALVVVLVLAAAAILYVQNRTAAPLMHDVKKDNDKVTDEKGEVVKGTLSVEPVSGRQIYEQGESIVLVLKGDSDGKDAVGFDAALEVNQNILLFSQAESKLPSFETFDNVNAERVYIGGIRRLDSKNASIFDNADLAELTFKARAEGHSNVDFIFKPGDTTESNIVLTTSKDGLGDVKGTDIYIGKKISVTTGGAVNIPNTNISLTLKDVTTESATIDIGVGGQSEPKKFMWDAAQVSKNVEEFSNYVFQVEKGKGDAVVVYYAVGKSLN